MDTRRSISGIAAFSFTFTLIVYIIINDYILVGFSPNPTISKTILEFLSAIGFYLFIFTLLYSLYSKYFFRIFDRRFDVEGEWYQIFLTTGLTPADNLIFHGPCNVRSSIDGISFSAIDYSLIDKTYNSIWQSDGSILDGAELTAIYHSSGYKREENAKTVGTMIVTLKGSPPTKMIGNYFDSAPAKYYGPIFLYKDKSEYEMALKSFDKVALSNSSIK